MIQENQKLEPVWRTMKNRCVNPNAARYKDYGGRGIGLDEAWMNFENFKKDMGRSYKQGLCLDRKDNEKGYSKSNCRWVTYKQNNRNKRNNRKLSYANKSLTLIEWSELLGIKRSTLAQRYYVYGWSVDRVLSKQE